MVEPPHKIGTFLMPPLTERQETLFRYMAHYWAKNQYLPSHREMTKCLGLKSNNATPYVNGIIKRGYLMREENIGRIRNLKITHAGIMMLEKLGEPFFIDDDGNVVVGKKRGKTKKKK